MSDLMKVPSAILDRKGVIIFTGSFLQRFVSNAPKTE
jgi:hypothetical protein